MNDEPIAKTAAAAPLYELNAPSARGLPRGATRSPPQVNPPPCRKLLLRTYHSAGGEKPGFQKCQRTCAAATGSLRFSLACPFAPPEYTGTVARWAVPHRANPGKSSVSTRKGACQPPLERGTLVGTLPPRRTPARGVDCCAGRSGCQARTFFPAVWTAEEKRGREP